MEPGAAGRQWVPFLLLAPAIRGAAQAHLPPPENADRPVGRALSHRLFSDRPGRRRQSRAEGELGQAAAERRAAICRDGGLPALVAAERRQQAELLLCVGRGERSLLDGGAGDASKRNCCFVSGEASEAFWTVAPATLAPPQLRPFALVGAVIFGTAVGYLRVVFGRHFVSDIVFAGLITIVVVFALYRLLLDPVRRNDARLERGLERVSIGLHRGIGAVLGGAGRALASAGSSLHSTGQHLHKRVACL
jgi:hypothetical protein